MRIGCSGFSYIGWKGVFYPGDIPQNSWLRYYSSIFATVELNVTFYRLPLQRTFEKWYEETPSDFCFCVKGSRLITHAKRLSNIEEATGLFCERSLTLKEKLKSVLWQFPPDFSVNVPKMETFLELLGRYPFRNVLEFRHDSWIHEEVAALLSKHNAAFCIADWPEFSDELPLTGDFVYVRRHGSGGNCASSYSWEALQKLAGRIRYWLAERRDVFVYFNNDACGFAPQNARELIGVLSC